jgi:predicted nucleic acid-binding Zn ribbon protein
MKRRNEYSIKEVLEAFVKAYRMEDKLNETELMNSWDKVVGPIFSNHTQHMSIKNKILYVQLDSAVLRNELMIARSKLVEMLNREIGKKIIEDIVLR